jgi:hypothetical protein
MYLNPSEADAAIYFLERVAPRSMKDQELLDAIINVLKDGYRHDVFGGLPKVTPSHANPKFS